MQGLSLLQCVLSRCGSTAKGKIVYSGQGELLFTHFGLSGPLILSASAHMREFDTGPLLHQSGPEARTG